jgi:hypothetical protein
MGRRRRFTPFLRIGTALFPQQPPGVEDVQRDHREDNRHAVEHIKVDLSRDDSSRPSIVKLGCSINGADEHPDCRDPRAQKQEADLYRDGASVLL